LYRQHETCLTETPSREVVWRRLKYLSRAGRADAVSIPYDLDGVQVKPKDRRAEPYVFGIYEVVEPGCHLHTDKMAIKHLLWLEWVASECEFQSRSSGPDPAKAGELAISQWKAMTPDEQGKAMEEVKS
jgi:hypothetical protein